MSDSIQRLWTAQHQDAGPPSADELRLRATRLHRQIFRRNATEYAAGAAVAATFAYFAWVAPTIFIGLGCLAIIAGVLVTLWNLHRHRARRLDQPAIFEADCRAFLRTELVRQRDALNGVWRWYLLPMEPGMLLFLGSVWHRSASSVGAGEATARLVPVLLFCIGTFVFVHWINRLAARGLQKEIDALDL